MKKSRIKTSGIYKILNKINGKYYIGSSNDILGTGGRWNEHINDLNANRHANVYLQRSWNKYGKDAFDFTILEEISENILRDREQEYLDIAEGDKQCYNLKFVAGPGGRFSEQTLEKIRAAKMGNKNPNYGKSPSDSTRKKMSDSHKGSLAPSYDHTIYVFEQINDNKTFRGTRYEFVSTYGISRELVRDLTTGRQKKTHGWRLKL